jgi:hypothetical protein
MKFFTLMHTFTRGWDESEFPRLLHAINRKFLLSKKLEKVKKRGNFRLGHQTERLEVGSF